MRIFRGLAWTIPVALIFFACVGDEPDNGSSSDGSDAGSDAITNSDGNSGDGSAGDGAVDTDGGPPAAIGKFDWTFDQFAAQGTPAVASDGLGNVYFSVFYQTTIALDATHSFTNPNAGTNAVGIAKVDSTGKIVWAVSYGSPGVEVTSQELAADAAGDVYFTGQFQGGLVFDLGNGVQLDRGDAALSADAFVAKIHGTDGSAIWARDFSRTTGVGDNGYCGSIAVRGGRVGVTCASTKALTFILTNDSPLVVSPVGVGDPVNENAFFASLDPATGKAYWATAIGAEIQTRAWDIDVDSTGALIFSVLTNPGGPVHDATNTLSVTNATQGSGELVGKLKAIDGTASWAISLVDDQADAAAAAVGAGGVAIAKNDDVIVSGEFTQHAMVGGKDLVSHGGGDLFVARLAGATGNGVWSTSFGGSKDDGSAGVGVDAFDEIFVTASYDSADFSIGASLLEAPSTPGGIVTLKLDPNGAPLWGRTIAATNADASSTAAATVGGLSRPAVNSKTQAVVMSGYFYGLCELGGTTVDGGVDGLAFIAEYSP